jgi:hypothetical protein
MPTSVWVIGGEVLVGLVIVVVALVASQHIEARASAYRPISGAAAPCPPALRSPQP